ncbi:hypothetical protein ACP4OV_011634 [Aristida adscensionis]
MAGWTAEDDVLLRNAVEAGASLESLAKGAVCFSHKFTLQELQDRWHSLLYDSETSAQASARIANYEIELSTSNPAKGNKLFNSKAKVISLCKRKTDSVKNQYYAMRKRVCLEPCLSADFGYVIGPCTCIDDGGFACGGLLRHSEGHLLVQKVDPSGSTVNRFGIGGSCGKGEGQHAYSNGNEQYSFHTEHDNSDGSMVIDGNANYVNLYCYPDVDELYGHDNMQKNPQDSERNIISLENRSDLSDQYGSSATGSKAPLGTDQDGIKRSQSGGHSTEGLLGLVSVRAIRRNWCSVAPGIPAWNRVQGANSLDVLTHTHRNDREVLMLPEDKKLETTNSGKLAFQEVSNGGTSDSSLDNAMISEHGFMHSHLKGFSHKEDLELLSNEHFTDSAVDENQEDMDNSHTKVFLKGSSRSHHLSVFDATKCGSHIDPTRKKHNVADVSGVESIPTSSEVLYPGCDVECMLNMEDFEIPFNNHILIPGQSSLEPEPDFNQDSQCNACLIPPRPFPSQDADDCNYTDRTLMMTNMEHVQPVILEDNDLHSVEGEEASCGFIQHQCCENLHNLTLDKSIHVQDQMNWKVVADKTKIGHEICTKVCNLPSHALPVMESHNPIAILPALNQADGSDSENSVPDYFDLESLILDQDLIPWDQESEFTQPEVSRFHHQEIGKDLIRLERSACSYMNRSIMSKGAFAVLYGQHLKYYIRDPEVTLGRKTADVHVDIDLGKEGKANKISRRQAVIRMDDGGSFYIKNIGKCSISVNSKEVPYNKRINLISDSLLEIRDMKFIFHVNQGAVRKHILRTRRGSFQGENTTFDWSQNP